MSQLRIFSVDDPATPLLVTTDGDEIAAELKKLGAHFERWQATHPLTPGAPAAEVMAAYQDEIDKLVAQYNFKSIDVVSIAPDNPQREEMRNKFLNEHHHKEDEVRFFVAGSGMFNIHVADKVYEVVCVKDDLILVPDQVLHWFDMGAEPYFIAIRFFTAADGWVGHFSESGLSANFPRYTPALQN